MQEYQQFYSDILTAIENNQLRLPTQPEVAVRIREAAEDPNVSGKSLADVINKDPALTARLIGIANSPLMRGMSSVDSLPIAINRLGVGFVANLATGLAMEQIFYATDERVHQLMEKVWSHSALVAAYCMVIAKHFAKLPQDQATLAGLLHPVGILPILSYAEMHEEILEDEEQFIKTIETVYPKLGQAILESWKFPKEFCAISTNHTEVKRNIDAPDLSDVIQVANVFLRDPFLPSLNKLDTKEFGAFKRVGIEYDYDFEADEQIKEQLEAAKLLFKTH